MALCLPDHSECDCYGHDKEQGAVLQMIFESQEHLDAFTSWLSNSGEQSYYDQGEYEDPEDAHLYHTGLDYHSKPNTIIVKEYPKDAQ